MPALTVNTEVLFTLLLLFALKQGSTDQTPVSNDNATTSSTTSSTESPTSVENKLLSVKPATTGTSSAVQCKFRVADNGIEDLVYHLKTKGYKLLYLTLVFPEDSQVSHLHHVFRPYNWVWTYRTSTGAEPFLDWPLDYRVLSLGVLDSFTRDGLPLQMKVDPADCPIVLGSNSTTLGISNAIGKVVVETLSQIKEDYNHSIWCYQEIRQVFEVPDLVTNSLGILSRVLENRCCHMYFYQDTRSRRVSCDLPLRPHDQTTTTLPYILGVIALLYFPIWLCSFAHNMSSQEVPYSYTDQERHSTLDVNISHNVTWLYQGTRSPVTLSSMFSRTVPHFGRRPYLTSRLQRIAFLFLFPLFVYIRLILYFTMQNNYLSDCVDKKIPIGYLSVLYGFEQSRQNAFTVLGGPYILHGLYFTVGAVVLCVPCDLSRAACTVLHQSPKRTKTPLRLDLDVISKLGGVCCSKEDNNFRLICRALQANLFMLINIDFWTLASKLQYSRFIEFTEKCSHLPRVAKYVIMTPVSVLYIIHCFTELLACVFYYGVPLIYFFILIMRVYIKLTRDVFNTNGYLNNVTNPLTSCLNLLKYPLSVLLMIILCYNLYTFCAIVVSSFAFLFGVMTFAFIGLVAYPSIAFGYYIFAMTSIYYIWKAVRDIDTGYMKLFRKTVSVSKACEKEMPIAQNITPPENGVEAEASFTVAPRDVRVTCVRLCRGRPGIPKDLFEMVIEKHRPFRVCLLVSVIKLAAVFLLIVTTIRLVNNFNRYNDISVIVSFLSSLIVVSLPRVVSLVLSDTDGEAVEEDFNRRLSRTVKEYWGHKDRRELLSVCWSSQMKVEV